MATGYKIDKEKVIEVKQIVRDYPTMPQAKVAKLSDISVTSVKKILNGELDHLMLEPEKMDRHDDSGLVLDRLRQINTEMNENNEDMLAVLDQMAEDLRSLTNLVHIVAVALMRRETDKGIKATMSNQIQHVHSNKDITDAVR